MDAYEFSVIDEFDDVLLNGVKNGFFDIEALKNRAEILNKGIEKTRLADSFQKAWATYTDSFEDNEQEVAEKIYHSFKENTEHLSHNDLNNTVKLLKEIGRDVSCCRFG